MNQDILQQYRALRKALETEKAAIIKRLANIEDALGEGSQTLGMRTAAAPKTKPVRKAPGRRKARGKNKQTLREAVNGVLTGKALNKKQILDSLKSAGYVFSSKNPMNSLGVLLYTRKTEFKNNKGIFSLTGATAKTAVKKKPAEKKKTTSNKSAPKKKAPVKRRRKLSAEARAKIVPAQKKRWAKVKKKRK